MRPQSSIAFSWPGTIWMVNWVKPAARSASMRCLISPSVAVKDVVRTRMYVVSADDADAVGRAHAEVFGDVRPVATMVVVARLIRPEHLVEVEVEAYVSGD